MYGLVISFVICLGIVLSSIGFFIAIRGGRTEGSQSRPTLYALQAFWVVVAIMYVFMAVRMVAAYAGDCALDKFMFMLSMVPFAFLSVPLVYFVLYLLTGSKRASAGVSGVFALFGVLFLALLFTSPIPEPSVSYWASIISVQSTYPISVYLALLYIVPIAMILGILLVILLREMPKRVKYRITLSLVAISLVFDFVLTDIVATLPELQLASRIFVFIGVVLAFLAYFPPMPVKEKLGLEIVRYEPDEEEMNED